METRKLENDWVWMEIKGHYFYTCYKPGTNLDLNAAKTIIRDATTLSQDILYPALTDIADMPAHPKEVREYFAKEGSHNAIAHAIIVSNALSKLLANFFLTLNKPIVPTRLFTDVSKAAKWLEMFPVKARTVLV